MRILKAVLVDDEAAANKVLASLLAAYEDIEIVGQYTDPDRPLKPWTAWIRIKSFGY